MQIGYEWTFMCYSIEKYRRKINLQVNLLKSKVYRNGYVSRQRLSKLIEKKLEMIDYQKSFCDKYVVKINEKLKPKCPRNQWALQQKEYASRTSLRRLSMISVYFYWHLYNDEFNVRQKGIFFMYSARGHGLITSFCKYQYMSQCN